MFNVPIFRCIGFLSKYNGTDECFHCRIIHLRQYVFDPKYSLRRNSYKKEEFLFSKRHSEQHIFILAFDDLNMSAASISSGQHLAAILPSKSSPFEITHRPNPTPGPDEVLVQVKSIAINPIDSYQRYAGFVIDAYPSVIGSDIEGVIISTGSAVSADLKPGTRVATFAPCFFKRGASDYGAFQELALIPSHLCRITSASTRPACSRWRSLLRERASILSTYLSARPIPQQTSKAS